MELPTTCPSATRSGPPWCFRSAGTAFILTRRTTRATWRTRSTVAALRPTGAVSGSDARLCIHGHRCRRASARLAGSASDNYDSSIPAGYSLHADWVNGWKPIIEGAAFIRNCDQASRSCFAHLLGNGQMLLGAGAWIGRRSFGSAYRWTIGREPSGVEGDHLRAAPCMPTCAR